MKISLQKIYYSPNFIICLIYTETEIRCCIFFLEYLNFSKTDNLKCKGVSVYKNRAIYKLTNLYQRRRKLLQAGWASTSSNEGTICPL